MKEKVFLFVGATGLIGSHVLEKLNKKNRKIFLLSRLIGETNYSNNIKNIHFNFDIPYTDIDLPYCDHLFICIGRRLKVWELLYIRNKDRKDHYKIEHDYVLKIAKKAKELGTSNLSIISAVGAKQNSFNFYLKTKGQIEESLKNLGFENISILRPGHIIVNKSRSKSGNVVWLIDFIFNLLNPFLLGFLKKYRGISLDKISEFMASHEPKGTKIFYYDDFIK